MEPDDLLCSRNAQPRRALVGRAQWETNQATPWNFGRHDLAADPTLQSRAGRFARVDEIDALIEAWTGKHTKQEAMEILAGAGVACGAVLDSAEVLADEHLRGRGMVVDLEHPDRGRFPMLGNPVHLSDSPTEVRRAPLLGEHTAEVLGGLLGLSADELAQLKKDGAV